MTEILTTVETDNWASLAEVRIEADADSIALHLSGPEGSIAATDPMVLNLTKADAAVLHRQLGEALGAAGSMDEAGDPDGLGMVADIAMADNDAMRGRIAQLEVDLRAAVDERDRLAKEVAAMRPVVEAAQEIGAQIEVHGRTYFHTRQKLSDALTAHAEARS